MALTPAERMARTRARRREDRMHLAIDDVDRPLVEDALIRRELLDAKDVDDRAAFAAAARAALEEWAEQQLTPPASPENGDVARNVTAFRFLP
jgi:hypothetical protein